MSCPLITFNNECIELLSRIDFCVGLGCFCNLLITAAAMAMFVVVGRNIVGTDERYGTGSVGAFDKFCMAVRRILVDPDIAGFGILERDFTISVFSGDTVCLEIGYSIEVF